MSVARTVYRQLLQTLQQMARDGLPCTGCVGIPEASHILCPATYLAHAFRNHSSDGLNDAFFAMRILPKQYAVLQASQEETRQALQGWHTLQQQWCTAAPLSPAQQLHAAEEAGWLLQHLATQQAIQQLLLDEEIEETQQQNEAAVHASKQQLDDLAAAVQAAAPEVFSQQGTEAPNSKRVLQLQALSDVLFQQKGRLRCEPFEWVYDGLAPLLTPQVLLNRKGIPLSLSVIAGAVGRRLGMQLQLLCADDSQLPGTASGPLMLQQLPPEVAARQAGRTLATAPAPTTWLLQLLPLKGQAWNSQDTVFLDVSKKGELLDMTACTQRYPAMQNVLLQQQQQQQHVSMGANLVAVWSDMARTMVLAHQRRGESDLVAHWLYQLLALDSRAEEWAHAMN